MFKKSRSLLILIKNLKQLNRILITKDVNSKACSTNQLNYEIVIPQEFSKIKREFPSYIRKPSYAENGLNDDNLFLEKIVTHKDLARSSDVIKGVKDACSIAKQVLQNTKLFIRPGMTGEEIDEFVYRQCLNFKCYPSPLNYNEFPKSVTLSVNNVAIHGIPDQRKLKKGDILKVDVSLFYDKYHGDTAETYLIGEDRAISIDNFNLDLINLNVIDKNGFNLIKTAKECLDSAIEICKEGIHISEIGTIVDKIAKDRGFNVVPAVCGHSIGEYLHGLPQIVHCALDEYSEDMILLENMLITIEPVICEFEPDVKFLDDGWAICTEDNGRTAQFEHTILIKKTHAEILT